MTDRVISPTTRAEDTPIEQSLRPRNLAEYIGQEQVVENLRSASTQPKRAAKRWTTSSCTARRVWAKPPWPMSSPPRWASASKSRRGGHRAPRRSAAILTNLRQGDILFIDEVHR